MIVGFGEPLASIDLSELSARGQIDHVAQECRRQQDENEGGAGLMAFSAAVSVQVPLTFYASTFAAILLLTQLQQ